MWPQRRKKKTTKQTFFRIVLRRVRCVYKKYQNVFFTLFETAARRGQETEGLLLFYSAVRIPSNFPSRSSPLYMNKLGDLPWAGEISSDIFLQTEQSRSRQRSLLTTRQSAARSSHPFIVRTKKKVCFSPYAYWLHHNSWILAAFLNKCRNEFKLKSNVSQTE